MFAPWSLSDLFKKWAKLTVLLSDERRGQPCCRDDSESVRTGCDTLWHSTRDRNRDSARDPPPWGLLLEGLRCASRARTPRRFSGTSRAQPPPRRTGLASVSTLIELLLAIRKFVFRFHAFCAENDSAVVAQESCLSSLESWPTDVAAFATPRSRARHSSRYRARRRDGLGRRYVRRGEFGRPRLRRRPPARRGHHRSSSGTSPPRASSKASTASSRPSPRPRSTCAAARWHAILPKHAHVATTVPPTPGPEEDTYANASGRARSPPVRFI